MIWGEDAEIKVLEEQNKICSAMFDHEKMQEQVWDKHLKKEVAQAAAVPQEQKVWDAGTGSTRAGLTQDAINQLVGMCT